MHSTEEVQEHALLVALNTGEYDVDRSLAELEELVQTAGIQAVGTLVQAKATPEKATFLGSGKLEELAEYAQTLEADIIIFDHELTATQIRNIEQICDRAVIDRTMLILDIFAQHAHTAEGRLQVELAQHRYLLPRLAGMGKSLSRLGGGGGGDGGARRGKGETKLELDRRHIRRHITMLEQQLLQMEERRKRFRERRQKDRVTTVAIVGYTNVGKSTLLNALTDAGVLAENKLFATLDPTSRALELPDGRNIMLIDTVGLIRRLPHHLVKAFHSTLEEALYADLVLVVADVSSSECNEQIEITTDILQELGVHDTPILYVLNKSDLLDIVPSLPGEHKVYISAKTGKGLPEMLEAIGALLPQTQTHLTILLPYSLAGLAESIRKDGLIFTEEYRDNGLFLDAMVDEKVLHLVQPYTL